MRIVVGASAGGAFDTYGRIVGRHLGKHIPGNPAVVVENVTGAGGLILANQIYKTTRPDGLTIATFNGGLLMSEILGRPGIEFDARKFEYLIEGTFARSGRGCDRVCITTTRLPASICFPHRFGRQR